VIQPSTAQTNCDAWQQADSDVPPGVRSAAGSRPRRLPIAQNTRCAWTRSSLRGPPILFSVELAVTRLRKRFRPARGDDLPWQSKRKRIRRRAPPLDQVSIFPHRFTGKACRPRRGLNRRQAKAAMLSSARQRGPLRQRPGVGRAMIISLQDCFQAHSRGIERAPASPQYRKRSR